MEFPQNIWDIILEYNGFMIDATLRHIQEPSMWATLGVISYFGEISVSPKHFVKVLKYLKCTIDNDFFTPHVYNHFLIKYGLHKWEERIYDKDDYLYHYLENLPPDIMLRW